MPHSAYPDLLSERSRRVFLFFSWDSCILVWNMREIGDGIENRSPGRDSIGKAGNAAKPSTAPQFGYMQFDFDLVLKDAEPSRTNGQIAFAPAYSSSPKGFKVGRLKNGVTSEQPRIEALSSQYQTSYYIPTDGVGFPCHKTFHEGALLLVM